MRTTRFLAHLLRSLTVAAVGLSVVSCAGLFTPGLPDNYAGPAKGPTKMALPSPEPGAPQKAPVAPPIPPSGPIRLGTEEAVVVALQNNEAIRVAQYNPEIRSTAESVQRAAFDPTLSAGLSAGRTRTKTVATTTTDTITGDVGVTEFLPTGTTIDVTASGSNSNISPGADTGSAGLDLTVTQALLRGFGPSVNLASLRQAKIDTESSQYEFRGFVEAVVAQVEESYWDHFLAQKEIEIFTESLKVAGEQLRQTDERIKVGKLAETERAAAEAEVALRKEGLINARSRLDTTRLQILRLLNPPSRELWLRELEPTHAPAIPETKLDSVEAHVAVALKMRSDLNQARLQVQRGDLEVVKTRNGLLPRLDAFVNLGSTAFANSFSNAVRNMDDNTYGATVGLRFEYPIGNRAARANDARAHFSLEQSRAAVANAEQLVQLDVRSAYIEVIRSGEQIIATQATLKAQKEKLRAEQDKFNAGRSTSLLVAQAQRDLLQSQIDEISAVTAHLKSYVELYRLEGSLLLRRLIAAPGEQTVDISKPRQWN